MTIRATLFCIFLSMFSVYCLAQDGQWPQQQRSDKEQQRSDKEYQRGAEGSQHQRSEKGPRDFQRLADELQLRQDQYADVQSIMERHHEQRRSMHRSNHSNMKEQMDAMDQSLISELSAVLDSDQIGLFENHIEKRKQQHRSGRHDKRSSRYGSEQGPRGQQQQPTL